ncbi:hypothetical protein WA026_004143 [Henosepilachna vigintioctopunctata]|uniref:Uncharacterized protein n=1 Tax=Henosepilachna vigintioctopunctata TaxID=420089 RepID=A0AAW1UFK8_9CUCU
MLKKVPKNIIEVQFSQDRGFSVVAPELAVPGKTTAVLVTLHGPASLQPLNVTLKLVADSLDKTNRNVVETTAEIRGE